MAVCKNCNSELPEGAMFCMKCGTKVETELFCPQCGEKVPAGATFCMKCGAKIGGAAAAATATKQAAQGNKIVVSPDGSTGYSSIQAAVDAASDGMMIEIMPGTYKENIKIGNPYTEEKKNIALVGIADDNGNFPTIMKENDGQNLISIYGNVNLYRLNLKNGNSVYDYAFTISALSDSFVYSELNFAGTIKTAPVSDDYAQDCEISNCTLTEYPPDSDYQEESNYAYCFNDNNLMEDIKTIKTSVKIRDCNFEKGMLQLYYCDIENCSIGKIIAASDKFSIKNSTITRTPGFYDECSSNFINCKFLNQKFLGK